MPSRFVPSAFFLSRLKENCQRGCTGDRGMYTWIEEVPCKSSSRIKLSRTKILCIVSSPAETTSRSYVVSCSQMQRAQADRHITTCIACLLPPSTGTFSIGVEKTCSASKTRSQTGLDVGPVTCARSECSADITAACPPCT